MDASVLLKKYEEGRCTPDELALLESWYLNYREQPAGTFHEMAKEEAIAAIHTYLHEYINKKQKKRTYWRYYAAASIIALLGVGSWWFFPNKIKTDSTYATTILTKVAGQKQAYLTLDNGKRILLDAHKPERITQESGLSISKADSSILVYDAHQGLTKNEGSAYHTITTPKGATFAVQLSDGTKVWLNTHSSLRFPTQFSTNRMVELRGEAYFEVNKSAAHPFQIAIHQDDSAPFLVEVLGTTLNVHAYTEETFVKTTLISGKIRTGWQAAKEHILVKPRQQVISAHGQMQLKTVDIDQELAWKSGSFAFDNTDIHEVMEQLSRWYNVRISYSGTEHHETFTGYISRSIPLGDALAMLEKGGGVSFTLSDNHIQVHFLTNPE
ncbi:DUF4974 domain-containing protein [Olivibacter ginsenosidimutans]|uniref:DUF4974 domain-containing protein n=1 Tax=Olivibacter ginsenosidimutans TaxID=1176537 RepID=A0ABP9B8E8_9SPHI